MSRIAISVLGNIANANGTTVRARSVIKILRNQYEILVLTRATSIDDKSLRTLKVNRSAVMLARPEGSKLWNLKLVPIILHNRFHCVYCVADMFGFITYRLLSRLLEYKIIFEAHALAHKEMEQVSRARAIVPFLLETFIGKNADAIIALSGVTYSFYRRLNENTFFVPVFIDDDVSENSTKQHLNRIEKVVGLVGPFDTTPNRYQLDFLYTNLGRFNERIRFKIIGKCDRRLSSNRMEYTGYLESTEEYLRNLSQLDALMVPVQIATFGPKNKILEAMACGVPVFTTYEGIVGLDFARGNENIFVFEENDLVSNINKILFDESSLGKIRKNALNTVKILYSTSIFDKKILDVLERTLRHV